MSDALTSKEFFDSTKDTHEIMRELNRDSILAMEHSIDRMATTIGNALGKKNGNGNNIALSLFGVTIVLIFSVAGLAMQAVSSMGSQLADEREDRRLADQSNDTSSIARHDAANDASVRRHYENINRLNRLESYSDSIVKAVMSRLVHAKTHPDEEK